MDALVERKVLGLLGLGVRGRMAVVGVERVREAVKGGKVRVAIVADDASPHGREKVTKLLEARRVPMIAIDSAATLGGVAGKETTTVIGVVDAQLAAGILAAVGATDAVQSGSRRKG